MQRKDLFRNMGGKKAFSERIYCTAVIYGKTFDAVVNLIMRFALGKKPFFFSPETVPTFIVSFSAPPPSFAESS